MLHFSTCTHECNNNPTTFRQECKAQTLYFGRFHTDAHVKPQTEHLSGRSFTFLTLFFSAGGSSSAFIFQRGYIMVTHICCPGTDGGGKGEVQAGGKKCLFIFCANYFLSVLPGCWCQRGGRWKHTLDRSHTSHQTKIHVPAGGHEKNMQT